MYPDKDDPRARCWLEVGTSALLHNLDRARARMHPGTRLIAVLKADAYGLGATSVGRVLADNGVEHFAVACLDEAFALRRALPGAFILCMGESAGGALAAAIERDIRLTCGGMEAARRLSHAAQAAGKPARVHFKLDTGLSRLGFLPGDTPQIAAAARLPGIEPEGLYTHLALHDQPRDQRQHTLFERALAALCGAGLAFPLIHMLDSIGLVRYPAWQYDAVRVGALLYGNYPNDYPDPGDIRPVAAFRARVTRVFRAPAGAPVGYDGDSALTRDSTIATLSAGYADGYPRAFSGKGFVLVRGCPARVLGLVCMDQLMADVTGIPGVRAGDIATLLGEGVTLRDYARRGGLNRNECTAIITARVPRVYL